MPVEAIETVSLSGRVINCQAVRTCGMGDLVAVTLEIQSAARKGVQKEGGWWLGSRG